MNLLVVFLTLFATANGCYSIANGTSYYLSLNTTDLYNAALSPNRIGSCYILRARGREACDLYIKSAVPGTDGDYGWPKTGGKSPRGNGCVIAPNLPKGVDSCFYWPRKYWMSWDDKLSFCQGDGMENAVTQLRHALRHNACGLDYIAMGEDDLWAAATGGNKVGGCYIEEFSHFPVLCFAFVKTATTGVKGVMG